MRNLKELKVICLYKRIQVIQITYSNFSFYVFKTIIIVKILNVLFMIIKFQFENRSIFHKVISTLILALYFLLIY